ncbi:tripartite tricarboxylate transporter permease [Agarilytica rhodophyticola]|uniref:tripartite tricarboxylate transporter permease n=1 Tax=Agarilytica rhodophyticola TaxID=1737490 RepID=UPI000B3477FC|nr:tripartite tricarboxylate transporter permease [Agarilytica rhodophyticola]
MINVFNNIIQLLNNPSLLLWMFVSVTVGIIVGALPGLTATMSIAILVGLTYGLSSELTFAIILSVYVGAIYGGSITAILLNIPGTASAAATALDGHPLAQQGKANYAIGITRMASFLGTLFGLILLLSIAPLLAEFAIKFTSIEMALLALLGVLVSGFIASPDLKIKGWISAFIGMLISAVGIDLLHGHPRFTFDQPMLTTGFAFVPIMIGVFGISQVLDNLSKLTAKRIEQTGSIFPPIKDTLKHLPLTLRSGIIGTSVGIMPGAGEDMGGWLSYFAAKFTSKKKDLFGKGSTEGIIAAETGNNASIGGALIPLLTLSIPGSAPAAVLLGALLLHGIRPGPMLMTEQPDFLPLLGAILFIASCLLLIAGIIVAKFFIRALDIPANILMPMVAVMSVIGAYTINIRIGDVYVMLGFGLIFYIFHKQKYPMAPLVLGVILGPMIDENLRRAFWVHGDIGTAFSRPIAMGLIFLIVILLLSQISWLRERIIPVFKK